MYEVASQMSQLSSVFSTLAIVLKDNQRIYKPQVLIDARSIVERVRNIQVEIWRLLKRHRGI